MYIEYVMTGMLIQYSAYTKSLNEYPLGLWKMFLLL